MSIYVEDNRLSRLVRHTVRCEIHRTAFKSFRTADAAMAYAKEHAQFCTDAQIIQQPGRYQLQKEPRP